MRRPRPCRARRAWSARWPRGGDGNQDRDRARIAGQPGPRPRADRRPGRSSCGGHRDRLEVDHLRPTRGTGRPGSAARAASSAAVSDRGGRAIENDVGDALRLDRLERRLLAAPATGRSPLLPEVADNGQLGRILLRTVGVPLIDTDQQFPRRQLPMATIVQHREKISIRKTVKTPESDHPVPGRGQPISVCSAIPIIARAPMKIAAGDPAVPSLS